MIRDYVTAAAFVFVMIANVVVGCQAHAEEYQHFATVEYNYYDGFDKKPDGHGYTVIIGSHGFDLKTAFTQNSSVDSVASTVEAGYTPRIQLTDALSAYVRVAFGDHWANKDAMTHYLIEPGVKYAVSPEWTVGLGYRHRDTFQADRDYLTHTVRATATYALSDRASIGLRYDNITGVSQQNSLNAIYSYKF